MVSGTPEEWKALAKIDIPVCVCPRANAAFGIDVDLAGMVRSGLRIVLGTDNAMAVKQDMFREMEAAWTLLRKGGMGGSEASKRVFDMAIGRTLAGTRLGSILKTENGLTGGWPASGDRITLIGLSDIDGGMGSPIDRIVRFSGIENVLY
jgi:cytosine/adenosine deaminase-related metal-dependent hydrolase